MKPIGLAMSIDYCLFMMSRYNAELAETGGAELAETGGAATRAPLDGAAAQALAETRANAKKTAIAEMKKTAGRVVSVAARQRRADTILRSSLPGQPSFCASWRCSGSYRRVIRAHRDECEPCAAGTAHIHDGPGRRDDRGRCGLDGTNISTGGTRRIQLACRSGACLLPSLRRMHLAVRRVDSAFRRMHSAVRRMHSAARQAVQLLPLCRRVHLPVRQAARLPVYRGCRLGSVRRRRRRRRYVRVCPLRHGAGDRLLAHAAA